MTKKFLHVDVRKSAETTIVIEYDTRDWQWPHDRDAMMDFAIERARSSREIFGDNDFNGEGKGPSDDGGGFDVDVMPMPGDWLWRRFKHALADHRQVLDKLVCPDDKHVYLQVTVDGQKMRSLVSIDLQAAQVMIEPDDIADVVESFFAVTGLKMGIAEVKAVFVRAFS